MKGIQGVFPFCSTGTAARWQEDPTTPTGWIWQDQKDSLNYKPCPWQQRAHQQINESIVLEPVVWGEQGAGQVVLLHPASNFCQTEARELFAPLPDFTETAQRAQEKDRRISEASSPHEAGLKILVFWKEMEDQRAKCREVLRDE